MNMASHGENLRRNLAAFQLKKEPVVPDCQHSITASETPLPVS